MLPFFDSHCPLAFDSYCRSKKNSTSGLPTKHMEFSIFIISCNYNYITIYNTVILVRSVMKFWTEIFSLSRRFKLKLETKHDLKTRDPSRYRISPKNFVARCAWNVLWNVCVLLLFQWSFLDQINFETKQQSKCKVHFNFIFISIEK